MKCINDEIQELLDEDDERKMSWFDPEQLSISTVKPFIRKRLLYVCLISIGILYHEILKPGEAVNTVYHR